jgi:hypothetical protein
MLTIQNIETLIYKAITIKGYTFVIGNVLTSPEEYRIVIDDIGTVHASIIVILNRAAVIIGPPENRLRVYPLKKYGCNPIYLYRRAIETENEFTKNLESYLNTI